MKLLEYARDLKDRAEARSQDVRAQENFARHQESRAAAFERALVKLQAIEELSKAVREAGIGVVTTDDDEEWARGIAAKVQEAVATASGHELDRLSREAESAVVVLSANADRRFEVAVERWAERQSSPSDHVVDLLGRDEPVAAERTREAAGRLQGLLTDMPRDADGIYQLTQAAQDLAAAYATLAGSAPEAVGEFLEKARIGVPLSDIDQSVIDWLRDKKVASSFIVRLRG